jgi:hypothetical protein
MFWTENRAPTYSTISFSKKKYILMHATKINITNKWPVFVIRFGTKCCKKYPKILAIWKK